MRTNIESERGTKSDSERRTKRDSVRNARRAKRVRKTLA